MSSFDEAIRQHLDLKRRHGADPQQVARLEREAFDKDLGDDALADGTPRFDGVVRASRHQATDRPSDVRFDAGRSALSQETVEIDMGAFIDARRIEDGTEHRAYDWSADVKDPDIGDPTSNFEWETPQRARAHGAV